MIIKSDEKERCLERFKHLSLCNSLLINVSFGFRQERCAQDSMEYMFKFFTIKKYIQDQDKYDIIQDKLSVKEYEEPFKG